MVRCVEKFEGDFEALKAKIKKKLIINIYLNSQNRKTEQEINSAKK